ncbi:hypothetical protein BC834DRAFT_904258 [Gloeopeniophorella convolvens]|nr:hypothetical protein BC834DRAFT_904258 [Gloeopeniophorella convolvens]
MSSIGFAQRTDRHLRLMNMRIALSTAILFLTAMLSTASPLSLSLSSCGRFVSRWWHIYRSQQYCSPRLRSTRQRWSS